jgi:hypothetical protein
MPRYTLGDLYQLLTNLEEYLEPQQDVLDGEDGSPRPNRAMQLHREVEQALQELKSGPILP